MLDNLKICIYYKFKTYSKKANPSGTELRVTSCPVVGVFLPLGCTVNSATPGSLWSCAGGTGQHVQQALRHRRRRRLGEGEPQACSVRASRRPPVPGVCSRRRFPSTCHHASVPIRLHTHTAQSPRPPCDCCGFGLPWLQVSCDDAPLPPPPSGRAPGTCGNAGGAGPYLGGGRSAGSGVLCTVPAARHLGSL